MKLPGTGSIGSRNRRASHSLRHTRSCGGGTAISYATPHNPLGGSMTHAKLVQWSAILFLTLIWANSSLADNCNGNWSNVTISAETLEVATGHTVTYFVSRGSTTSANSPFNGVGECGGYALATPDGKVRVAGICTRKMNDGASESD